jgi:hypothetical protein
VAKKKLLMKLEEERPPTASGKRATCYQSKYLAISKK